MQQERWTRQETGEDGEGNLRVGELTVIHVPCPPPAARNKEHHFKYFPETQITFPIFPRSRSEASTMGFYLVEVQLYNGKEPLPMLLLTHKTISFQHLSDHIYTDTCQRKTCFFSYFGHNLTT